MSSLRPPTEDDAGEVARLKGWFDIYEKTLA